MRKEIDSLGEVEIDDNKYYGIHTLRALENFDILNCQYKSEKLNLFLHF